jgi:putative phosphoesterase
MKIGLISDTHGHLDPRVHDIFAGVSHILHGGDIGYDEIIFELQTIAPVTAVLGNNDAGLNYRETEVVTLAEKKFLVHHILVPRAPHSVIREAIERETPDVVVFGHSHQPHNEVIGRTLYLNPGYSGKPRFRLERSVALLHIEGDEMRVEFRTLS